MKKICKMISTLLIMFIFGAMCACGKGPIVMDLDMKLKLSEYDDEKGIGNEVSNNKIECGKKYALSFVWENQDIEAYNDKIKNKEVPIQIMVTIGEVNSGISAKFAEKGGLSFSEREHCKYGANFTIKKDVYPDFDKGYFVIYVDSMEGMTTDTIEKTVSVCIKATGDYAETVSFTINGSSEMKNDIIIGKGTYAFNENENVNYPMGRTVKKTTMEIILPKCCPGIKISIYKGSDRKERYGVTDLLKPVNGEQLVTVVLADYIKQFIGEDAYETKLNNGGETFYLTITAIGDKGYKDASFNMDYVVK